MHLGHFALVDALSSQGLVNSGPLGTTAVVVSSDLQRIGGFHESILGAIKGGGEGSGATDEAAKAAWEGDLRGQTTNALWSIGPWRFVSAPGVLNTGALITTRLAGDLRRL